MAIELAGIVSGCCRAFIVRRRWIVLMCYASPEQAAYSAKCVGLLDWFLHRLRHMMHRFVRPSGVIDAHMCVQRRATHFIGLRSVRNMAFEWRRGRIVFVR